MAENQSPSKDRNFQINSFFFTRQFKETTRVKFQNQKVEVDLKYLNALLLPPIHPKHQKVKHLAITSGKLFYF